MHASPERQVGPGGRPVRSERDLHLLAAPLHPPAVGEAVDRLRLAEVVAVARRRPAEVEALAEHEPGGALDLDPDALVGAVSALARVGHAPAPGHRHGGAVGRGRAQPHEARQEEPRARLDERAAGRQLERAAAADGAQRPPGVELLDGALDAQAGPGARARRQAQGAARRPERAVAARLVRRHARRVELRDAQRRRAGAAALQHLEPEAAPAQRRRQRDEPSVRHLERSRDPRRGAYAHPRGLAHSGLARRREAQASQRHRPLRLPLDPGSAARGGRDPCRVRVAVERARGAPAGQPLVAPRGAEAGGPPEQLVDQLVRGVRGHRDPGLRLVAPGLGRIDGAPDLTLAVAGLGGQRGHVARPVLHEAAVGVQLGRAPVGVVAGRAREQVAERRCATGRAPEAPSRPAAAGAGSRAPPGRGCAPPRARPGRGTARTRR